MPNPGPSLFASAIVVFVIGLYYLFINKKASSSWPEAVIYFLYGVFVLSCIAIIGGIVIIILNSLT